MTPYAEVREMIYFMEKMSLTLCMAIKEMMTLMEMQVMTLSMEDKAWTKSMAA